MQTYQGVRSFIDGTQILVDFLVPDMGVVMGIITRIAIADTSEDTVLTATKQKYTANP